MKKVDDKFKREFKEGYRENVYVTGKVGASVLAVFIGLAILVGIGGVACTKTISKTQKETECEYNVYYEEPVVEDIESTEGNIDK